MRKAMMIGLVLTMMMGCSDFKNSPNSSSGRKASPEKPSNQKGDNSFASGFDPQKGPFSEDKMLAQIGLNVIYPAARDFRLQSELLAQKTAKLCRALKGNSIDVDENEKAVKDQWRETMLAYHRLAAVPVGPLSDNNAAIAVNLYAWPYTSSCNVDVQVATMAASGSPKLPIVVSAKGLSALEYLFFEPTLTTECHANNTVVQNWVKKTLQEKKIDRCVYADYLNQEIVKYAKDVEEAWDQNKGNFSKTLIDGSRWPTLNQAINALSDALFSIELVKDSRLGKPIGSHKDCRKPEKKCPELVEHRYSQLALPAIQAHLASFQQAFWGQALDGGNGFGFDDLLLSLNRQDVANRLEERFQAVMAGFNQVKALGSLKEQIGQMSVEQCQQTTTTNRVVPVCALHQDLKEFVLVLKTDFLTALSLRAPPVHEGDGD